MRMSFLHTCKRLMAYGIVLSMLLNISGPLFCWERDGARYTDAQHLSEEEKHELNILLNTTAKRSVREDLRAPRTDATSPSAIVSPYNDATLKLILECLCSIKRTLQDIILPENIIEILNMILEKTCAIESVLDTIDLGKLCTIDSKVDIIDDEVEFAVSKICVIDSKIDELFIDFQETWTVIGANYDPVPTPDAILDVNATTSYTVLQWLKAIYHKVK